MFRDFTFKITTTFPRDQWVLGLVIASTSHELCTQLLFSSALLYKSFTIVTMWSQIHRLQAHLATMELHLYIPSLIARFMGPTWGTSGADRTQVGPMLAHELYIIADHVEFWYSIYFFFTFLFPFHGLWAFFSIHISVMSIQMNKVQYGLHWTHAP